MFYHIESDDRRSFKIFVESINIQDPGKSDYLVDPNIISSFSSEASPEINTLTDLSLSVEKGRFPFMGNFSF